MVAFLKSSGLRYIAAPLNTFLNQRTGKAELSVGIDHDGTSLEGLQDLWRVLRGRGELYVFKEGQGGQARTFHPKAFLFKGGNSAVAIIGSGNLTAGGLFTNHELAVRVELDLGDSESARFVTSLDGAMDDWQRPSPACLPVDQQLLRDLVNDGDLLSEATIAAGARAARTRTRRGGAARTAGRPARFGASGAVGPAPTPPPLPPMAPAVISPPPTPVRVPAVSAGAPAAGPRHQALLIEVRPHHNGEIFLSKTAVNDDPGFFGFPFAGWTSPKTPGNRPYPMATPDPQVEIVVYDPRGAAVLTRAHSLNTVFYAPKREIRITIPPEPLARIPQLSLLVMTRNPNASYDYRLEFYPPTCRATKVRRLRSRLIHTLPSGGASRGRRYGWA